MKIFSNWGRLNAIEEVTDVRVKKYIQRVKPVLASWVRTACCTSLGPKLRIEIGLGLGTFISAERKLLSIGFTKEDAMEPYNVFEKQMLASASHECGHENFTPFSKYSAYGKKISEQLVTKGMALYGVPRTEALENAMNGVGGMFCNVCEDGRIENMFGRYWPNMANSFRWSNLKVWKKEEKMPERAFDRWMRGVLWLSIIGPVRPKWIDKVPKGDELPELLDDVYPIMEDFVQCETWTEGEKFLDEIYARCEDYLLAALEDVIKQSPAAQALQEALEKFKSDFSGTSGAGNPSGSPSGSGSSSRLKSKKSSGKDKKKDGEDGSGSKNGKKSKDKKEGAEGKESGAGGKDGKDGESESSGEKTIIAEHEGVTESEASESSGSSGVKNLYGDSCKSGGGGSGAGAEEDNYYPEAELEALMAELEEEAEYSVPEGVATVEPMTIEDELAEVYEGSGDRYCVAFVEKPRTAAPQLPPAEIVMKAGVLKNAINKIKAATAPQGGHLSGKVNKRKLYRYPQGRYDIFCKKQKKEEGVAAYICWDGSGSMYGLKQTNSGNAVALIEKAFSGIPMKIINFTTDGDRVIHHVVKDFDEDAKSLSFAYGYYRSKGFSGGNKDGYSIRVATKQLLERDEKRKILIVLSDGLPSDYSGGFNQGVKDVNAAVKEAVDKGCEVIAIFFGEAYDREELGKYYKAMYHDAGAQDLSCSPAKLGDELVKIFTKIALQRS